MGQSEELACAIPFGRCLAGLGRPEHDQRRLLKMHGQANAGKPLGQHGHDLPGARFPLTANAEVIAKASQEAAPLQPHRHEAKRITR
jgi:hypothetical protein